jgi:hypothetical protein
MREYRRAEGGGTVTTTDIALAKGVMGINDPNATLS